MRLFSAVKMSKYFLALALVLGLWLPSVSVDAKPKARTVPHRGAGHSSGGVADEAGGDYVTEKRGDTTVKYKKKTTYDFEGLGVEAMADKPTGAYISNIKDVKARSLIQIRKDFDAEVNESARQMP